ncbi:hypothetical protein [Kitasatospora sp. CB02891]|uniref:hypothetical protein n=1 Tax=Kitasatospora sp. CB02891 TaxID=2020329 RepID=UPI000C279071|nr:hypothetical protein [Kitasatospora sp. CB02891]PJN21152.1 hypothetical protein CG736_35010 [Kitasatospora sp. CB02891]
MTSMLEEYLPTPQQAKDDLHYDENRLAQVEADEPSDPHSRFGWLSVRRNIFGDLADRASALALAWDRVGDEAAATATVEVGEHYLYQFKLAEAALEDHRRQLVPDTDL